MRKGAYTMWKKMVNSVGACALLATSVVSATGPMEPVQGRPKAEQFNLEDVSGNSVSLEDYKGKFVLLNFWATWCAPCREEMPSMSNLHDELSGRGLEVVGVHVGPSLAGVKKFLESVPVNFTILIDKNMQLTNWGVRGLPTTFLINPDGRIVYEAVGERDWSSPEMVLFLKSQIKSYERMANGQEQDLEMKNTSPEKSLAKSFWASLKESVGWSCDNDKKANQLLPN